MLVDEAARRVYVQSHGRLAVFDAKSAGFWLDAADVLPEDEPIQWESHVYYVGSDIVDNSLRQSSFSVQSRSRSSGSKTCMGLCIRRGGKTSPAS